MDLFVLLSSMLEDPLPWIIAALTIIGPALAFMGFLWLFRVKQLVFLKSIRCPEDKREAMVELVAQVGETGSYRDVRRCSLRLEEKEITCRKTCLTSPAAREAPYIAVRRYYLETLAS